jgi:PAS domain S-box-containing protein
MRSTVVPDEDLQGQAPAGAGLADVGAGDGSAGAGDVERLAEAFEHFTQKAAKLRQAYARLKRHVDAVNRQLEAKNLELRRKIDELDETQAYLNNVLESMGSGVIAVDPAGLISTFNAAAEQMTGYRRVEVLGRPYAEVFPQHDGDTPAILLSLETQMPHVFKQRALYRCDGRAIPVGVSSSPLRDSSGAVTGALEIFHDLTELRRLEERVRCADRLAALGQMAATVAHEIRNPLGGIEGFAALLERDLAERPEQIEMARQIVQGARSLNRVVTSLLDFTRPVTLKLRRTRLRDVVDAALAVAEQEFESKSRGVTVVRAYAADDTATLDPEQIYRVVLNLVRNAWQAIHECGEISVEIAGESDTIVLRVCDTGCGMPPDVRERLFSPFFTTKETGTGLGLSIVRKIVLAHGGTVEVETEGGAGTTFVVTLPRSVRPA